MSPGVPQPRWQAQNHGTLLDWFRKLGGHYILHNCSSKQVPRSSASVKDLAREAWIPRFFAQILTPISNLFQGGAPFGRRANIWRNSWRERKDRLRKAAQRWRNPPRLELWYNSYTGMRFHFDERKSKRLRANPKRGISFEEAQEIFSHPTTLTSAPICRNNTAQSAG